VIGSPSGLSAPAGFRFPREVIAVAVRWYLRYGLSYRDVEELLAERGIEVDHVTIYRWVQTFTLEFIDAARPARHATGDRGSSTRPTSRSLAAGPTCTGQSTSTAK
jgi:transposase-like protein